MEKCIELKALIITKNRDSYFTYTYMYMTMLYNIQYKISANIIKTNKCVFANAQNVQ